MSTDNTTAAARPLPSAHFPAFAASIEHDRQRASKAQQMHAEATARELPDDLFADDPEIQCLTRAYEAVDARVKGLPRASRAGVHAELARIEQEFAQVQGHLRAAAVDDVLDGDFEFSRSAVVSRRGEALRLQLEAARLALEVFAKSAPERNHFDEELRRAREARSDALIERKRAHVAAHPGLLESSLDVVRQQTRLQPAPAQQPISVSAQAGTEADELVQDAEEGAKAEGSIHG